MKNRRAVCSAKDAGQVEFVGLPGSIRTGCTETPELKSRYCSAHKGRACRSSPQDEESIVEILLDKKSTRSQTYYKVRIHIHCIIHNISIKHMVIMVQSIMQTCCLRPRSK